MKLRKKMVLKIGAGVLLILLSAAFAFVIRDMLAMQHPENALPDIQIDYIDTELPAENWMMDSYSWRFLLVTKSWQNEDRDAWRDMPAAPVLPGAALDVSFSYPCETLKISRSVDNSVEFLELGGQLETPQAPGVYTYMVEAGWGARGSILYYFKVVVNP